MSGSLDQLAMRAPIHKMQHNLLVFTLRRSYSTHKLHSWNFNSLSQSGSLQAVGSNENGQLGLGDAKHRLVAVLRK